MKGGRFYVQIPLSPGWFTALMAFLLTVGTAAPWFASVLALTAPAVYADAAESLPEDDGAPAAETGQKLIALTFDDGPRRSTTTALLDGLAQRGVNATFFLIGEQLVNNEDVVQRMDAEGHQIGIHTFDHVKLTGLSKTDFDAQVDQDPSVPSPYSGAQRLPSAPALRDDRPGRQKARWLPDHPLVSRSGGLAGSEYRPSRPAGGLPGQGRLHHPHA